MKTLSLFISQIIAQNIVAVSHYVLGSPNLSLQSFSRWVVLTHSLGAIVWGIHSIVVVLANAGRTLFALQQKMNFQSSAW